MKRAGIVRLFLLAGKERVRTELAMRVQLYLWAKEDALMMYCVEDN